MARFTAVLFASLAALGAVSASPVKDLTARDDSSAFDNAIEEPGSDLLNVDYLGNTAGNLWVSAGSSWDLAITTRSSAYSGSATYTQEGLVSRVQLVDLDLSMNPCRLVFLV